jgi:hypothetical protein
MELTLLGPGSGGLSLPLYFVTHAAPGRFSELEVISYNLVPFVVYLYKLRQHVYRQIKKLYL